MKLLDYEIKVEDLSCIEYSHCPRSEQSDERYRDAPVVYDNFMRIHMPASLFLRYRASREFKSIVSKKLAGDSPRTLVTRADALVNFLAFLAEKKTLLQHLSFEDIREYADDMAAGRFSIKNIGTSLAPSTILVRAQTAAMFGEFLNFIGVSPNFQLETLEISKRISGLTSLAGLSLNNEVLSLKIQKKEKVLPLNYPLGHQIQAAIDQCELFTNKTWLPLAIELMYQCGLRRSEVECSLPYPNSGLIQKNLKSAERYGLFMRLKVTGKGNKERTIEMPIDLFQKLTQAVLSYPGEYQKPELPVLINLFARGPKVNIARRTLGDAFKKEFLPQLSEIVGKDQGWVIHDLRHIFGGDKFLEYLRLERPLDFRRTQYALGGSSFLMQEATEYGGAQISSALIKVRRLMGHASTETTNIYIDWAEALLRLAEHEAKYDSKW